MFRHFGKPSTCKMRLYSMAQMGHFRSSNESKVKRVQEPALQTIYCDRTSTYEALLDEARRPTLRNLQASGHSHIDV